MTKRTTKRALLTSVMSLFLCFTMLLGTTYAWFTDTVSSANNIITAGNLDVELEYYNGSKWVPVTETTNVFEENTLWEPGHTEVVYLKVSNLGTLALKYNLAINVAKEVAGINVKGEVFKLSNVVEYQVIDLTVNDTTPFKAYADRAAALAAVTAPAKLASAYSKSAYLTSQGDAQYVAMVVYMPESVGNEANYKTGTTAPSLDLGIRLFATQYTSEKDSFDFTYDKGAPWTGAVDTSWFNSSDIKDEYVIDTAEKLAGFAQIVNTGYNFSGKTVKLGGDIDLNNLPWTPIGNNLDKWNNKFTGSFYGNGYTISNLYVTGSKGVGLFGYVGSSAHLEGITIKGAYVAGNDYVGAVMGSGYLAANCLKNCTVMNATIVATPVLMADGVTYDGGAKAGAVAGYALNGNISGNKAMNCTVSAYRDLGGIVGMADGADRAITASQNTVDGVTLSYVTVMGPYYENKPNQNMDSVIGRKSNITVEDNNDVKEVKMNQTPSFTVSNDAELSALLSLINSSSYLWNKEIEIILNENTYVGAYSFYQYPTWNGKADGTSNLSQTNGVADHTLVSFKGVGEVVFTNSFEVTGWGQAGNGFGVAQAATTFEGITFKGKGADTQKVLTLRAAANNVTFKNCSFKDAKYITLGNSGQDASGSITFDFCNFENGNCLSQYYETLTVTNSTVKNAFKGFINKGKAGAITIEGCTIEAGEYLIRTQNNGINATVKNSDITVFEVDGAKDLVKFRGGDESANFTDCNIAEGYTTAGVDSDSTLTITNFTETEDGLTLVKDGISGNVTLYLVPADYEGKTVNVPEGVDTIGGYAFAYNSNVETIVLPSTVKTLNDRAFRDTSASTVILNEGLENISYQAFRNASNMKEVVIPSTVKTVSKEAFQNSGVETLTIPATVQTIEYGAMRDMKELVSVTLEGNADIPVYAFRACTNLKTVIIKGTDVTFGGGSRGMIFTNKENGDGTAITVTVANETIKERLLAADTAAKDYGGYTIVCEQTQSEGGYFTDAAGNAYAYDDTAMDKAIASGAETVYLSAGNYTMPSSSSDVTIVGTKDTKVELPFNAVSGNGNVITFEGITVMGETNSSWYSTLFNGATKVVYKSCDIYNQITTYCDSEFIGCNFYNTFANDYSVYCYSGKTITFDGCYFDTQCSKAIKVYDEGNGGRTVNVKDCTFTTVTADKKAAVEIDSSFSTYHVYFEGNNVLKGAYTKLWNSDPGEDKGTNVYINGVAQKSVSTQDALNSAVTGNGTTVDVTLSAGNYTLPTTSGDVVISGTKDTVVTVYTANAKNVAFNGITVKSSGNAYTGIQSSNKVVYTDCTLVGNMYLYAKEIEFVNCTFDLENTNDYIWVYAATNVTFTNCTFNTMGKAILVFQDGSTVDQTVTVEGCTFNATKSAYNWNQTIHISAVSIDGSQGGTYNVVLNNNKVDSDFNGLWQDKTSAGNVTVSVDGEVVLTPNN